jgi:hypothetical protein
LALRNGNTRKEVIDVGNVLKAPLFGDLLKAPLFGDLRRLPNDLSM